MRKIFWLCAAMLALAACGQSAATVAPAATSVPATAQPTEPPAPTTAPPAALPTSMPSAVASPAGPQPGAGGTSVRPPDTLVNAAQQRLAAYLKLDPSAVVLQSANAREWPDGALGCPQAGMAYPQVVTSGFVLVFTDAAQSQSYEVHTGAGADQLVLCQNQLPTMLGADAGAKPPADGAAPALDASGQAAQAVAQAALAQELGLQPSDITLMQAEPVEWNDSSLGCPKPDQVYMQVVTPGYKFTFQAQGTTYEYHTDSGKRAVRCTG